jgi:hypothetical protein
MIKIIIRRRKNTIADTMWRGDAWRDAWTEHHIDRKSEIEEEPFEIILIRSIWEKENIDIAFNILVQENAFTKSKYVKKLLLIASIRTTIKYKLEKLGKE